MIVHQPSNSLVLNLDDPSVVTSVLPRARVVEYKGRKLTQVHYGLDEMRVLKNLGFTVPSPIEHYYDWPSKYPKPYRHQIVTSSFMTLHPRCIVLNDMGTAKTLSALWAADYLMSIGIVNKCIVACTKSTIHDVWENEVITHLLSRRKVVVISGDRDRKRKALQQDADIYVVGHHSVKSIMDLLVKRDDINLKIVDEAAVLRNATTAMYKTFKELVKPTDWLWLLTGTPTPTAPTDAWALAKLIQSKKVPQFFKTFQDQTMHQLTKYKWVPKPDAHKLAFEVLQPGIRFTKRECIDLPPVTYTHRTCDMTPSQLKYYQQMQQHLVAHVSTEPVTAANAAVKLTKLLQICTGLIYDQDGAPYYLDATPRLELVEELCEETENKVLIFVPFRAALRQVADHLRKRWTVETVDGSTSDSERKRIFNAFQQQDEPRIIVAHPKTVAHGLTLTRADLTIWYAPLFSLELFEQANNRMDRPGQRNPMTVAMMHAHPLEREVYRVLTSRGRMQDSVLELYKQVMGLN